MFAGQMKHDVAPVKFEIVPAAQSVHVSFPAASLNSPKEQRVHTPLITSKPGLHTHDKMLGARSVVVSIFVGHER